MRINEKRIRNIIKEELRKVLEAVDDDDYDDDWDGTSDADDGEEELQPPSAKDEEPSKPAPNFEDPAYIDDVAYVIACFCHAWVNGVSLKRFKEIAGPESGWRLVKEPDGGWRYAKVEDQLSNDQRRAAEHYISIYNKVMEYYESHSLNNFAASPQYFLDSLGASMHRQNPDMAKELQRKASKEEGYWISGVNQLESACNNISDWINSAYSQNNKNYSAGYLRAIDVIKNNPEEISTLKAINSSFSKIRNVLMFSDDEDLREKIFNMVLSGPDGAIQAGEILDLLYPPEDT